MCRTACVIALVAIVGVWATNNQDRYHPTKSGSVRYQQPQNPEEVSANFWRKEAQASIQQRLLNHQNINTAKNVIMFLGDGLSVATLAAARTLVGQKNNRTGEESQLYFETFPTVGLVKTYCVDAQIPDSACTATAYLCGVKVNRGTLGVSAAVPRWDCDASTDPSTHLSSIAAWALADGRDAGLVTNTRITHASPAGAYARSAQRGWERDQQVREDGQDPARCPDIAHQLIHHYPGRDLKVILGGGTREFLPESTKDHEGKLGMRTDGRDLIQEWKQDKIERNVSFEYVWDRDGLLRTTEQSPDFLLGLFEDSHLRYHLEADRSTQPTLTEMTEAAIQLLSRNNKGYFLFVESGRIDHAHHDNYVHLALDETIEMSKAVERAVALVDEQETLIVVTADHSHVMTMNGYTERGGDILGASDDLDEHNVPYMTLSYTNGPGARRQIDQSRPDVTQDHNFGSPRWRAHVEVPLGSETHGGDDVAVFARGPYHHLFTGLYEQSQLPHLMAYAACIGEGAKACPTNAAHFLLAHAQTTLYFAILAFAVRLLPFC